MHAKGLHLLPLEHSLVPVYPAVAFPLLPAMWSLALCSLSDDAGFSFSAAAEYSPLAAYCLPWPGEY